MTLLYKTQKFLPKFYTNLLSILPKKMKEKAPWVALFILTLTNISSFIDRQILRLLVKPIKRDLYLSETEVSFQEIMPNQVRALAYSIFLFILNLIGIGMGPTLVAVFTDYLFKDENMIRYSISLLYFIGGGISLVLIFLVLKPYCEAISKSEW